MRTMNRLILAVFFILAFIVQAKGQDVKVSASFDTSAIFIGDQIKFTVAVDQPADLKLTLPVYKDTVFKNIEIISGPVTDSSRSDNGRMKIIQRYLVTSFDSGFYQVPPVFAELKGESGLKRFYSDYSRLKVMRISGQPADTTAKIYDIIKPYRAPMTAGEILPWILIIAIAAIAGWFGYKYLKKLKKADSGHEVVINPDPAHVIAFRELERLRDERIWQKGEVKQYYTRLTEVLRQYLENRFRVFSLELTTEETLTELLKTGFSKGQAYDQLKIILTGADLVKFAKYNPEPSENESHFQNSWDFVMATKISEMIPEDVDNKDKITEENR
jgi:hypothetical protein